MSRYRWFANTPLPEGYFSYLYGQNTNPSRDVRGCRLTGAELRSAGLVQDVGETCQRLVGSREPAASLIEAQRSMRVMPSQWNTSGTSSWKRMSCTPATHSVRAK